MPTLFDPIHVGDLDLPNRIVMAPLTRSRAGAGRVPNALMADYYAQRASAGLILTEATSVTPMGVGYPDTPGHLVAASRSRAGSSSPRPCTPAGGRIFLQLWHVGRISHPIYHDGQLPVAPSADPRPAGHVSLLRPKQPFPTPRARWRPPRSPASSRPTARAPRTPRRPASTASRSTAPTATCSTSSCRTAPTSAPTATAARSRTAPGCCSRSPTPSISVWGPGRVGMHLAPRGDAHAMGDSDPRATFRYVARELGRRGIAFLCAREYAGDDRLGPRLRRAFGGVYIANERFTGETAGQVLARGEADAVAFGVLFIANPDLPHRLATRRPAERPRPDDVLRVGAGGVHRLSGAAESEHAAA